MWPPKIYCTEYLAIFSLPRIMKIRNAIAGNIAITKYILLYPIAPAIAPEMVAPTAMPASLPNRKVEVATPRRSEGTAGTAIVWRVAIPVPIPPKIPATQNITRLLEKAIIMRVIITPMVAKIPGIKKSDLSIILPMIGLLRIVTIAYTVKYRKILLTPLASPCSTMNVIIEAKLQLIKNIIPAGSNALLSKRSVSLSLFLILIFSILWEG